MSSAVTRVHTTGDSRRFSVLPHPSPRSTAEPRISPYEFRVRSGEQSALNRPHAELAVAGVSFQAISQGLSRE